MIVKNNKNYGVETKIVGGGGGGNLTTLNATQNGSYSTTGTQYDGYSSVTVNVQPNLTVLNAIQNGTYSTSGTQYDGFSTVNVNVQTQQWSEYLRVWYLPYSQNAIYPSASPSGFSKFRIQGYDTWWNYDNTTPIYPAYVQSPANWAKFYIDFQLDDPTTIPNNAFEGIDDIIKVELPQSVTTIGDFAFYNCHNLQVLPNLSNITYLGNCAICQNAIWIDSLIIDDNVNRTWLQQNYFHCSDVVYASGNLVDYRTGSEFNSRQIGNMSVVNFTNGVYGMPIYKFNFSVPSSNDWTNGYQSFHFPSMMTDMSSYNFGGLVTDIYFHNATPPNVFQNDPAIHPDTQILGHIYVPQGSLSAYQNHSSFANVAQYMVEMS